MIRKLTSVETCRVDALCMGPAYNQNHAYYEWDPEQVRRMIKGEVLPHPVSSLWQKLKALLRWR
jgi:hypothetical protein